MHTSRTALRHGRGNLKPDNKATNGATQYLAEVSYEISGDRLEFAASSLALGAGNCDQHGTANTILNGDNLAPGESMHLVSKSRPSLPRECARSWCR